MYLIKNKFKEFLLYKGQFIIKVFFIKKDRSEYQVE
jgi:hypothetical protein